MSGPRRALPAGSGLLIFVLCCAILYLAQAVLIPIALAALLTLLLIPAVNRLCRAHLPNVLAVILVVAIVALILMGGIGLVAQQLTSVISDLPKYRATIQTRIRDFTHSRMGAIAGSVSDIKKELTGEPGAKPASPPAPPGAANAPAAPSSRPEPVRIEQPSDIHLSDYLGLVGTALHPFSLAAIVLLLTTFMLMQRDDLHDRFLILSGRIAGRHRLPVSTQAIDEAIFTVSRYLWMQSGSNACMAGVIIVGLLALGVPNAALWGSLCFFLRFVPYVGILVGAGLTFCFTFATSADVATPFMVLILFAVVEFFLSSVLEPIFFGHGTGISSLGILISALFWTWLWGIAGLFLSVPMTVCWVMIGRNFENFDFLDTLLSSRAQLPPEKLLYHRLLVMDPADYCEAIDKEGKDRSIEEAFDEIMVPTICLAEEELRAERITQDRFDSMLVSLKLTMEELIEGRSCPLPQQGDAPLPPPANRAGDHGRIVLCLAAHGELDQLASTMLRMILEIHGCNALAGPPASHHAVAERIAAEHIGAVCINVLSSQSTVRAISWARMLRLHFPTLLIAIGLWNPEAIGIRRLERAKKRYHLELATKLKEAVLLLSPADAAASAPA